MLKDGNNYSDKVNGVLTYELNGTQATAISEFEKSVLGMAHVMSADKFEGSSYYMADGKKAYLYDVASESKSEVKNISFVEENGVYFVPKTIEIHDTGDYEMFYADEMYEEPKDVLVKTYDLSEYDLTGYVEAPKESAMVRELGPIYMDDNTDTSHYEYYMEIKDDPEFQKNLRVAIDGDVYIDKCARSNLWARGYVINRTVDGQQITVTFIDCDLFRDWLPVLLIEYILTVLIGIIVAAIVGKLRYNKKLVAYELDSYRRQTTNAMAHDLKSPLMAISICNYAFCY